MVEISGINHLHLVVSDLERSRRFYEGAFGLREVFRVGKRLVFIGPPSGAILALQDGPADTAGVGGILHFGFARAESSDLDLAIKEIQQAGGKFIDRGE